MKKLTDTRNLLNYLKKTEFFKVDFAKSVREDFKKIPRTEVSKILKTIKELSKNPRPSKKL
jgi:mRNA-degrading endonuclease RelE of RelBE toxin-antitoxin system